MKLIWLIFLFMPSSTLAGYCTENTSTGSHCSDDVHYICMNGKDAVSEICVCGCSANGGRGGCTQLPPCQPTKTSMLPPSTQLLTWSNVLIVVGCTAIVLFLVLVVIFCGRVWNWSSPKTNQLSLMEKGGILELIAQKVNLRSYVPVNPDSCSIL